jgi:hypothetical protein
MTYRTLGFVLLPIHLRPNRSLAVIGARGAYLLEVGNAATWVRIADTQAAWRADNLMIATIEDWTGSKLVVIKETLYLQEELLYIPITLCLAHDADKHRIPTCTTPQRSYLTQAGRISESLPCYQKAYLCPGRKLNQ